MKKTKKIISELSYNPILEFIIDSDDIEFKNGYGVASYKREYKAWDYSSFVGGWLTCEGTFNGIVDENLEEILPFKASHVSITNFGQGNFIVTKKYRGGDGEQVYTILNNEHIRIIDGKVNVISTLNCWDYKVVSKNTIVLKNPQAQIYNIESGTYVSEEFTNIEDFKPECLDHKVMLARATVELMDGFRLICFIDTNGVIKTMILSEFDGEEIDPNQVDFNLKDEIVRINELIKNQNSQVKQREQELLLSIKSDFDKK